MHRLSAPRVRVSSPLLRALVLGVLAAVVPPSAAAQGDRARHRVVVLETMPVKVIVDHTRAFRDEMRSLGYREGETLDLEVLHAEGDRERAAALLDEALAEGPPDLVLSAATMASRVALERLRETGIPLVFMVVTDPVGVGLIEEVGRPTGTNVTGRVYGIPREKKIEIARELLGRREADRPIVFGFLRSSYPSSVSDGRLLRDAAAGTGHRVRFREYEIPYRPVPDGLPAMLRDAEAGVAALEDDIDFWWQPTGALGERPEFTEFLLRASAKPIVYGVNLEAVKLGALFTVTPDLGEGGREIARLVDRILNGEDPGTLPPVPSIRFVLGVNLQTALDLGLVVPPDLLRLAGERVYR